MINKLGANTIYVYSVDTRNDHDGCMQEFANQGIYVWLQLGDFPRSTDTVRFYFNPNMNTFPQTDHN